MPTPEDIYKERRARIEAVGVKNLNSTSTNGCYAAAIACAMTALGVPTTAKSAEQCWHRKARQLPSILDVLAVDDFALSKGLKLHEITPPKGLNLEKYYKPGSKLTYDDFMQETIALYGESYATGSAKSYTLKVFEQEMAKRRERARRVRFTRAPMTPKLLKQLILQGPVILQTEGDDAPHAITAYALEDNEIEVLNPDFEYLLWGDAKNIVEDLDPYASALAISR